MIDSWQTNFPDLQSAIGTQERGVMNIFSIIILVIAGIGILNLLLMAVYERTREIGLLGALGLKPRQISDPVPARRRFDGAGRGRIRRRAWACRLTSCSAGWVSITPSSPSLTEYTALISGKVYPTLGLERIVPAHGDGADHRHAGSFLPGA